MNIRVNILIIVKQIKLHFNIFNFGVSLLSEQIVGRVGDKNVSWRTRTPRRSTSLICSCLASRQILCPTQSHHRLALLYHLTPFNIPVYTCKPELQIADYQKPLLSTPPASMASFRLMFLVAVIAIFHYALPMNAAPASGPVLRLFESWMAKYGFDFKGAGKAERLAVFIDNLNFIKRMNARKRSFKLGLNQFSHLRFKEFKQRFLGLNLESRNTSDDSSGGAGSSSGGRVSVAVSAINASIRPDVDWRNAGAVTPVKDQGACGEALSDSTLNFC